MQITTGNKDQVLLAKSVFLGVYDILPKWKFDSLFVCVKVGNCEVYTICDHIKPEFRTKFRDELGKLSDIALKK